MAKAKSKKNWAKKGLLVMPQKQLWWMRSHAMTPTVDYLFKNIFRVYFSGRDKYNRSHIGFVDINVDRGQIKIIRFSKNPVLSLGELGCFDDNGVTPSSIVTYKKKKYLYYIGWNSGTTVRMHLYGGLAISTNSGISFNRHSKAPILERTSINPLLNTSPFVFLDRKIWRMYYVAGVRWLHRDLPMYNIQYAESVDGLNWQRSGHVCIDFKSKKEVALARPFVLREDDIYKMWFCHKGNEYRLGYAESSDGKNWLRCDEYAGLSVSKKGWDNKMVAYPYVFKHDGFSYMLYNGNNYGENGIGYAIMENNEG